VLASYPYPLAHSFTQEHWSQQLQSGAVAILD